VRVEGTLPSRDADPAGQIFQIATTTLSGYALLKLLVGKELDQLGEEKDGAPSFHPAVVTTP
jgi:hypothetical protein